jgi:hypothetical protein
MPQPMTNNQPVEARPALRPSCDMTVLGCMLQASSAGDATSDAGGTVNPDDVLKMLIAVAAAVALADVLNAKRQLQRAP